MHFSNLDYFKKIGRLSSITNNDDLHCQWLVGYLRIYAVLSVRNVTVLETKKQIRTITPTGICAKYVSLLKQDYFIIILTTTPFVFFL